MNIQFHCFQCGNCCHSNQGYISLEIDEILSIQENINFDLSLHIERSATGHYLLRTINGKCLFYSESCLIHQVKPRQCKKYPFLKSITQNHFLWKETQKKCKGLRHYLSQSQNQNTKNIA